MGLSQQVAYSSLLAFFPAMIFLIAFLDLIGAYGALIDFLDPVAPKSVTSIIHQLERDTGNATAVLVVLGIFGALWAGSGAMSSVVKAVNRAYETTLAEGIRFERRIFHSLFATEDQKEGMRAFAEKRPAKFVNR